MVLQLHTKNRATSVGYINRTQLRDEKKEKERHKERKSISLTQKYFKSKLLVIALDSYVGIKPIDRTLYSKTIKLLIY